jgi:hypothetical protein
MVGCGILIKIKIMIFTKIPYGSPDLNAPGRGAEDWHNQNRVNIPVEGTNTQRLDAYFRSPFTWAKIETAKNVYNWNPVINMLNGAIAKRQKVRLGFMSVYHDNEDGVINYDGGNSAYPLYLHNEMQAESVKDWRAGSGWVPNYNSPKYLDAQRRFNTSLNNLLETGSNAGVKYKDIINGIDVRGYGNYGEWHNGGIVDQVEDIPAGAHATTATLKAIIDAHTQILKNFQLYIVMTAFDAGWLQHTRTAAEVGIYALTTRNDYGPLGWIRDNWGAGDGTGDTYIDDLLIRNNRSFNGVPLNSLIMNVYKVAPISGEPMNSTSNSFSELEAQIRKYHATSFGNGNITSSPNAATKTNFRLASKACGYRIVLESADIPAGTSPKTFQVKLSWRNEGIAPPYSAWDIVFDLVKGGVVVKSANSTFKLKLFQPAGIASTAVDNLSFDVADGTYELRIKVVDPSGYMRPMPLYIQGGSADGYSLGNVTLSGGVIEPPVNKPPVVSAGADREITLPTNSSTLAGTASDTDGTIVSTQWSLVSGPGTATIVTPTNLTTTVNLTVAGVYVFRLIATDNIGATSVDEVSVVVKPVVTVPPVGKKVISVEIIQTSKVNYDDGTSEIFT